MEEASLHTTRKHLFIFTQYYDKHGVPPTKRLFKVAMLDPSLEFIGSWGMSGDLGLPIVCPPVGPMCGSYEEWQSFLPENVTAFFMVSTEVNMRRTLPFIGFHLEIERGRQK
ncbi:hypothetical protein Tco_0939824 [Tanacetum coccineum]|uniref:Uncharacterized protein n=1 Tax=Tanacetum coccineum TaxID=301880 RepID=A0ABQ5DSB0_9ASTR